MTKWDPYKKEAQEKPGLEEAINIILGEMEEAPYLVGSVAERVPEGAVLVGVDIEDGSMTFYTAEEAIKLAEEVTRAKKGE